MCLLKFRLGRKTVKLESRAVPLLVVVLILLIFVHFKRDSDQIQEYLNDWKIVHQTTHHKSWIRISDNIFVYSAFLETRDHQSPYIKIVGLKRVQNSKSRPTTASPQVFTKNVVQRTLHLHYHCKLFYEQDNSLHYIKSENLTYFVYEEGVKMFAGTFFNCFFKPNHIIPTHAQLFISLYPHNVSDYPDKLVAVQRERFKRHPPTNLSVCVRPLFGPMQNLLKLTQFIAYYETQGVTHFTFYDLSISPRIRQFLQLLDNVQLLQWNLPTGNPSELWDYGTLTALHDCIYQSVGYVIVVDIDEFIVPQQHTSLIKFVHDPTFENIWQFSIRNSFFCNEFCSFTNSTRSRKGISQTKESYHHHQSDCTEKFPIFSCPLRTKRIFVHHRTKFIVNAEKVISLGHHHVTTFVGHIDPRFAKQTLNVPPSLVLLNHYRECESISSEKTPIKTRSTLRDDHIQIFLPKMKVSSSFLMYLKLCRGKNTIH